MLIELNINNFILIKELSLNFKEGLNIMTGETGAGKSLIIGALNMLTGEKANSEYVRRGSNKAIVEGIFSLGDDSIEYISNLDDIDIEIEDGILTITREIFESGRSLGRINGRVVSQNIMKDISMHVIDIHGQHDNQEIFILDRQLSMLDRFGKDDVYPLIGEVSELFSNYTKINKKLREVITDEKEIQRLIDSYKFQIEEIEKSDLKIEEEKSLEERYELLKNSEEINFNLGKFDEVFFGDNYSVENFVRDGLDCISKFEDINQDMKNLNTLVNDIKYNLEEIKSTVVGLDGAFEYNQYELEEINNRVDLVNNLKRKYGNTIEEILAYKNDIQIKYDRLVSDIENAEKYLVEKKEIEEKYNDLSTRLSQARKHVSLDFEERLNKEIRNLNLNNASVKVSFEERDSKLYQKGRDKIEFLAQINHGDDYKSLRKVASGGEISRLMLGFKLVLNNNDSINTMVFDEIDTGISGYTASLVAEKLYKASIGNQIICITHLPQISSMADHHYLIEKTNLEDSTETNIRQLSKEESINEISRMLGGREINELTIENARDLVRSNDEIKQGLISVGGRS
ncbi:MAG: DNA repair protein RecN [Firmicutes bacterium]|jgi:DNA repair protein RecN (Recombination protein N)|nr:DNA repair protein RecN [Bacillota bacterium]